MMFVARLWRETALGSKDSHRSDSDSLVTKAVTSRVGWSKSFAGKASPKGWTKRGSHELNGIWRLSRMWNGKRW
ncbi:unnamed protein product [Arabis nemorensis]|uniref:Uncharacterized protein n=1 Tax=Arabis nemorensis TaxID=586526 RepID=A0A565AWD1_9BRAS|nr:unnamed protein product [Arabis nemorensis]